jgi:S-adenosylmethionine synthetase
MEEKSSRWWCFLWKDQSKVDRSAAYATRHIAKTLPLVLLTKFLVFSSYRFSKTNGYIH